MVRNVPIALVAGGAILVAGLVGTTRSHAADRGFPVGGFDRIRSSVPFNVNVHTGPAPSVHAEGSKEALDRLSIAVVNGELVIGASGRRWWPGWSWHNERATIDVTVPTLTGAALSGPGNLAIDRISGRSFTATQSGPGNLLIRQADVGDIDLSLTGPGDLKVLGRATTARLTVRGPGDLRARELTVRDATVDLSGPGDIAITATGTATGSLRGPGDVSVRGGARCTISKRGPGDVDCG
jgi:hypothetical protein